MSATAIAGGMSEEPGTDEVPDDSTGREQEVPFGSGIALGLLLGVVAGVVAGNLGIWVGVGIGVGVALDVVTSRGMLGLEPDEE